MSVSKMMKGHELFKSLSFDEVERVSSYSALKPFEKGEFVFNRKDFGTHFFVVVKGKVNLILPSSDEESSLVVGRMEAGDIFGLSPLLGFERFTTTAQCTEQATVLTIEVAPFRKLLEDKSPVGLGVMNVVAKAYFSRYIETLRRFQNILNDLALTS